MKDAKPILKSKGIWLKIDLPAVIAFVFFGGLIFLYLIPGFEKTMMERKKLMVEEISASAYSLLLHFHQLEIEGKFTREEAQSLARSAIGSIRYGAEDKDYFWITDLQPVMIEHPYRRDLNGKDLSDFHDPNGKLVFVEFIKAVSVSGESFVDYMWQWNDDSTRVVPKLSFVRLFKPWGWIMGTGMYVEDVKIEIKKIESRAMVISGLIAGVIVFLLSAITRHSHRIELKRMSAESELIRSKELYRALAEAASEGVLVWSAEGIRVNKTLLSMLDYSEEDLTGKTMKDILYSTETNVPEGFEQLYENLQNRLFGQCMLIQRNGSTIEAHGDFSRLIINDRRAVLVVVRPVMHTHGHLLYSPSAEMLDSISTGFFRISFGRKNRFISASLPALKMLGCNHSDELKAVDISSLFVSGDQFRILKKYLSRKETVLNFPADLKTVSGNHFIAILNLVVVDLTQPEIGCEGTIEYLTNSYITLAECPTNPWSSVSEWLDSSQSERDLFQVFQSMRENAVTMTHFQVDPGTIASYISSVSDRVCVKAIDMALAESGPPPCRFAFIHTGSAGRMEQTLFTDQDNGIVFEDCSGQLLNQAVEYFNGLGKQINDKLNQIGYNLCKGGNMAGNPLWCQPLKTWKQYFASWVSEPNPDHLLDISIFFDFRHGYGDLSLSEHLGDFVAHDLRTTDIFFNHMTAAWKRYIPSADLMKRDATDIKKILMPLTGLVRLYSLKYGVSEKPTQLRIARLFEHKCFDPEMLRNLIKTWKDLMQLRLLSQVNQIEKGNSPDNLFNSSVAVPDDLYRLSRAIAIVRDLVLKAENEFYVTRI